MEKKEEEDDDETYMSQKPYLFHSQFVDVGSHTHTQQQQKSKKIDVVQRLS